MNLFSPPLPRICGGSQRWSPDHRHIRLSAWCRARVKASGSSAKEPASGAAGPSRIALPMPILTCDRALLVGIGLDQARIDGEAFTTNHAGRNARLDHPFEHTTENVSLAEALVAGA